MTATVEKPPATPSRLAVAPPRRDRTGPLLGSIYIVQNFDAVFTITSGGLGTANLPYTIYQTFYNAQDYGRASAAGVVVVIGTILIATLALRTVSSLFREEGAR